MDHISLQIQNGKLVLDYNLLFTCNECSFEELVFSVRNVYTWGVKQVYVESSFIWSVSYQMTVKLRLGRAGTSMIKIIPILWRCSKDGNDSAGFLRQKRKL